jgi:glycerophosphoryl diester phosphodiesterase
MMGEETNARSEPIPFYPEKNRFLPLLKACGERPAIVAHRGDSFRAPENTLEAAHLAWRAGASAWELDVRLTRDGTPIVLHDESLLRTTDVARRFAGDARGQNGFRVADFDIEEIKSLDAGSWFVAPEGGPHSAHSLGTLDRLAPGWTKYYRSGKVAVPTLAEALILTAEQDWLVNVEIKSFPDGNSELVERVLQVIEDTETSSRVLISSFDHNDVALANRRDRQYALGILTPVPLHRARVYASVIVRADTVHVSAEVMGSRTAAYRQTPTGGVLRAALVADLKSPAIPLLVYTVNDHGKGSLAEHLAEIGVSGLFTDDPVGMKRSFEAGSDQARAQGHQPRGRVESLWEGDAGSDWFRR